LTEIHSFRGYEVNDYEVALQAAVQIGWAEGTEVPGAYRISPQGRKIHKDAERLTDEYFYGPWSIMTPGEIDELYDLLVKLREELSAFRRER
jgi:hypothetical protein